MKLRYTMLHLTLDIEHSLKCLVLKLITENNQEDGYKIIDEFLCIDKSYSNSNFDTNSRTPEEVMETKIKNKNEIFKHMNKPETTCRSWINSIKIHPHGFALNSCN